MKHIAATLKTMVTRLYLPADDGYTALLAAPAEAVGLAIATAGGPLPGNAGTSP